MNRNASTILIIAVAAILICSFISEPSWIDDTKPFLKSLMEKEILSTLGIILTISLASAAQLHLEFNKLEEFHKKIFLVNTRKAVHKSAITLIVLFFIAIMLVLTKPILAESTRSVAFFNAFGLFVIFLNILTLYDLTNAAFAIKPYISEE